jgi:putative ABC transport system permease protein
MFRNYLVIAWRQILKNKLYAAINVAGLATGLAIYLFSWLLIDYEESHDTFFTNSERIFTVGSVFTPDAGIGVGETDGIYSAFAPYIAADIEEVEAVARTVRREFLLTIDDESYYERIHFADPEFLDIFDFEYLEGDDSVLDDPASVLLTRETAERYFGGEPAYGRVLTLDHGTSVRVGAVIENLPANTHLQGIIVDQADFNVMAPLAALNAASGWDLAGNWDNLSTGNFTYLLMPAGTSVEWLQTRMDSVYQRYFPKPDNDVILGVKVRPLIEANTILWDMIGMPILESIRVLGLLVLVVAIVNYTNLATAQSLGRAREIGLRKTMGASRLQLMAQFLVESVCVVFLAMLIALLVMEVSIPVFNTAADKALILSYVDKLPWLTLTTLVVGVAAGAYPAWLISRTSPIEALHGDAVKHSGGGIFRAVMMGAQFTITVFMVSMVLVMYFQNRAIADSAEIYPKSEIIVLQRLAPEGIRARLETLRNELENIPGVTGVAFVSQVPYEQSNSSSRVSRESGGEEADFRLNRIIVSEDFFDVIDIPLLAGRTLDRAIAADTRTDESLSGNVVVNEMVVEQLGLSSPQAALGQVFYEMRDDAENRALTIVGVVPAQNYQGFHNQIKPVIFYLQPEWIYDGLIRVEGVAMNRALEEVEAVWKRIIPDYPMQSRFLDDQFNEVYRIFQGLSLTLGGFAAVALTLSLIGLFGLAAFMAAGRTREIGVRKVMGASVPQIVRLLIWQISRPVLWALLLGLPLAYLASTTYLDFFANRIPFAAPIIGAAGVLAVVLAWSIVAVHAVRIARANPIHALRYE